MVNLLVLAKTAFDFRLQDQKYQRAKLMFELSQQWTALNDIRHEADDVIRDHPHLTCRELHHDPAISEHALWKVLGFFKELHFAIADALASVRKLSSKPTAGEFEVVLRQLSDVPNSNWFKRVSKICDRLGVLAVQFSPQLEEQKSFLYSKQAEYDEDAKSLRSIRGSAWSIGSLIEVLESREGDLKTDLRNTVSELEKLLGRAKSSGDVEKARNYAVAVQNEIAHSMDVIGKVSTQIMATSSKGSDVLLAPSDIAEKALRRPERMLILSMFFLVFVFSLGAFGFRFLKFYQFGLVTGFALTSVIVVNAFYLRTIDKLSEESFLKLMELALLKFFAPLTRRGATPAPKASDPAGEI